MSTLHFIDTHTGLIFWALTLIVVAILYFRHETGNLFPFLRETMSEKDATGALIASTKRMALIATVYALTWGFVKLTLAVCRWVDRGGDPTTVFIAVLMTLAGVGTGSYVAGKWIAGKYGASTDPNANLSAKD